MLVPYDTRCLKLFLCHMDSIKLFFRNSLILLLFLSSVKAFGVGAYPYPQDIEQPDGSVLTIRLHGDEWFNWVSTIDGYRITRNRSGVFEYASVLKSGEVTPSGITASNPENRDAEELEFLNAIEPGSMVSPERIQEIRESFISPMLKNSSIESYFPASGERKLLVILVTFPDKTPNYSQEDFYRYMNEEGYNSTGSFRDYYLENSNGMLDIESTVTVWVTVPNEKDYYGPRENWGEFAYHAVQAAAAQGVDFSLFDNTGNGVVEGVAIIHQGPGQEVTGNETDIWSHAWSLSSAGYSRSARTFNGVEVDRYTVQPETRNLAGHKNTIGVISHEFGHNLGIPDYYDTSDNGVRNPGTGRWDIMASGTYNGSPSGSSPAHHNAFSKIELGWVSELSIGSVGRYELSPVMSSQEVYRVNSPVENEYLLLENRRRQNFDSSLPGEDMVVYHVDGNRIAEKRNTNDINAGDRQGLYVMAAGGSVNTSSATFPGSLGISMLTDETNPATLTWSGEPFNRSITGIYVENEIVAFDFMAIQDGSPLSVQATALSHNEIEVSWTPSGEEHPVLLAFNTDPVFGQPQDGGNYNPGDVIAGGGTVLFAGDDSNHFTHDELEPSTRYYYRIWSKIGDEWSGALSANALTNAAPVTEFPWIDNFSGGLINWRQKFVAGNYSWQAVSSGIHGNPGGPWSEDKFARFYVNSSTSGVTRMVSPVFHMDENEEFLLEFRHFQKPWDNDQDELRLLARNRGDDDWVEIAYFQQATDGWAQRRVAIPFSGLVEIAFEGIGNYGYGIGVDDVVVKAGSHCGTAMVAVSNVSVSDVSETEMHITWNNPNEESSVLVLARRGGVVTEIPSDGISYQGNSVYGEGDELGNDVFVVYSGSDEEVFITDMHHSSNFYFSFFTYNDDLCYQFYSEDFLFSTDQRFYNLTFNVSDFYGSIEGALININGQSVVTNHEGIAYWVQGYTENYISVSASKLGYEQRWVRIVPDDEKNIDLFLNYFEIPAITGLSHTNDYKQVDLIWNPFLYESFDRFSAFSLSLPGWTLIDGDQSPTWSITGINFPNQGYTGSFIVLDPHYEGLLQADFDLIAPSGRHVLAAFNAVNGPNDDWLISPPLKINEQHALSLKAKTLSALYQLERIRVLVLINGEQHLLSEGDYVEVPRDWTEFLYSLEEFAGQTVQLAINYVSDDALAILIDQIKLETLEMPLADKSGAKSSRVAEIAEVHREKGSFFPKETMKESLQMDISGSDIDTDLVYYILLDGDDVGSASGIFNSSFQIEVDQCKNNQFAVYAEYPLYGAVSPLSDFYFADACHTVTFRITDSESEPLSNIPVSFNNETVETNSLGKAVFYGVEIQSDAGYVVDTPGYIPVSGSLDVNNDIEHLLVLTWISTDSTQLNKKHISLYPIPVLTDLYIQGVTEGELRIELYDFSGRLVKSFGTSGGSSLKLDMGFLQDGVYLLRMVRENSVLTYKVLKKSQ